MCVCVYFVWVEVCILPMWWDSCIGQRGVMVWLYLGAYVLVCNYVVSLLLYLLGLCLYL